MAPAAIVCTGYDSVRRFAGPIKRDAGSRLFITFPHCRIGVTGKWWRALKRESESSASGSVFGLIWSLLEEPRCFDITDFRDAIGSQHFLERLQWLFTLIPFV